MCYFFKFRPDNTEFSATKKRKLDVKIGDIVSFPIIPNPKVGRANILPKICKIRNDLVWADVVHNFYEK